VEKDPPQKKTGWRPPTPTMARSAVMGEAAVAPSIRPGEAIVRAGVTLVDEVERLH